MNKRTLMTAAAVLGLALVIYFAGPCTTGAADAQTVPSYSKTLTAGKHNTARSLSLLQVREPASAVFSVWGTNAAGSWVRVAPLGATGADTTLAVSSGSPVLRFPPGLRGKVIVVSSGSATFWGE